MDTREPTVLADWRSARSRRPEEDPVPPEPPPARAAAGRRGQVVEVDFGRPDATAGGEG